MVAYFTLWMILDMEPIVPLQHDKKSENETNRSLFSCWLSRDNRYKAWWCWLSKGRRAGDLGRSVRGKGPPNFFVWSIEL